ncbi:MAG: DUF802 domain-containing protein, partial [Lysobacteraceae bacterium]
MKRHPLHLFLFLIGLAAVAGIAVVHAASNPWVLAVTLLIGVVYLAGAFELDRYRKATASLVAATGSISPAPADLAAWLATLDPSLRGAVRLRIAGERSPLPAPALAGYLSGLLVLLGMLGTLLGMMATLRGTGMALETATDLQAIRDSLAAPVKGLGFAFGTSIAGIATSASLGLLAALCRRERGEAGRVLDVAIAGPLHVFTPQQRRDEAHALLQQQVALMPALVERLQAMADAIERRDAASHERQAAHQDAFHARTEAIHVQLAASVQQALHDSVARGAAAASEALQPMMQATALTGALDRLDARFEARALGLLDGVSARLDAGVAGIAATWQDALARQQAAHAQLADGHRDMLAEAAAGFGMRSESLLQAIDASHRDLQAALAAQDAER